MMGRIKDYEEILFPPDEFPDHWILKGFVDRLLADDQPPKTLLDAK